MKFEDMINNVIEGDCMEKMKSIPNKSIDMILCDLPYGYTQNKWDDVIPLEELWNEYKRIIKDRGVIALTAQGIFAAELIVTGKKLFRYKIVWIKSKATNFLNAKKQPLRKHEDICIFYKEQPVFNPQMTEGKPYDKQRKDQSSSSYDTFKPVQVKSEGERYPVDLLFYDDEDEVDLTQDNEINDWIYCKTAESEGKVHHPTQKPVELGRYLIRTYTKENDLVLDSTCGSGSFLLAALSEKRRFIGIEKNIDVFHMDKNKEVDLIRICKLRLKNIDNSLFPELNTQFK
jgi:site-specific DNA-methyltransferase (adenine-specific)